MTLAQQAEMKHDRHLGTAKTRNKTKIELLKDLLQSGHDTTKQRYLKADLLALCGQRNILVTVEECQVKEGWLGNPKGGLQILWEHGWIDSTKVVSGRSMRYSKDGKKEDFGEDRKVKDDNLQYVLTYLLSQCKDFKEEMCDLEYLAKNWMPATQQYPSFLHRSTIVSSPGRYRILLGSNKTNISKIASEEKKVLGFLQDQCWRVPRQDQH
jgi:hypothetical protein